MKHDPFDEGLEARLNAYEALLRKWAPRLDLISEHDLPRLRERHVSDSLRALPALRRSPPGVCIDVGSGAGLPGIPLALAVGRPWRLLEPRRRRAAFLEEVLRELELADCEVLRLRAEEAARDPALGRAHAFAVTRAVTAPAAAPSLLRPLLAPGGVGVIFFGRAEPLPPKTEEIGPGLASFIET